MKTAIPLRVRASQSEIEKRKTEDSTLFKRIQCTPVDHALTSSTPERWINNTIPIGRFEVEAEGEKRVIEGYYEAGLCKDCGSTLTWHKIFSPQVVARAHLSLVS